MNWISKFNTIVVKMLKPVLFFFFDDDPLNLKESLSDKIVLQHGLFSLLLTPVTCRWTLPVSPVVVSAISSSPVTKTMYLHLVRCTAICVGKESF